MKKIFVSVLLISISILSFAQHIQPEDRRTLKLKEDSLQNYAMDIIQGKDAATRFKADSMFTRMFVKALTTKNSFYYPFDSLITISNLYPPDSSFRIYTWQMVVNELVVRHHGAIQMRTYDGSLKLYPLIDKSVVTQNILDTIGDNKGWIGAVYYKLLQTKSGNQPVYTLLGYDEHTASSNRKIIEMLSFSSGEPIFGGRYFSYENDEVKKPSTSRYIMEYKYGTSPKLNYEPDMNIILVGHLESETNEPKKKFTYVPNGDYEGFRWSGSKWIHIENVRNYTTRDKSEILSNTIYDKDGNVNKDKLKGDENDEPATPAKPKPAIPKKK